MMCCVRGAWCIVHSVWCVVCGVWCAVCSARGAQRRCRERQAAITTHCATASSQINLQFNFDTCGLQHDCANVRSTVQERMLCKRLPTEAAAKSATFVVHMVVCGSRVSAHQLDRLLPRRREQSLSRKGSLLMCHCQKQLHANQQSDASALFL